MPPSEISCPSNSTHLISRNSSRSTAPFRTELHGQRFDLLTKKWRVDVELFRDENVPIETQITKTVTEYDKICGEMMVNFQGKDYTLQQMQKFIERPDRPLRQEAWELVVNRRVGERGGEGGFVVEVFAEGGEGAEDVGGAGACGPLLEGVERVVL